MFKAAKVEASLVAMAVMDQTHGSKCLGLVRLVDWWMDVDG